MGFKIKDIKNVRIQKMALLNVSQDFEHLTLEELEDLGLIDSFAFTEAKYPKNFGEDDLLEFWKKVLIKEESEALEMLKL